MEDLDLAIKELYEARRAGKITYEDYQEGYATLAIEFIRLKSEGKVEARIAYIDKADKEV